PMPERLANKGEPHVFAVFVAVADDDAVRARPGDDGEEFRLRAGLEPDPIPAMLEQRVDHAALLVDFYRVDRGVATTKPAFGRRGVEGAAKFLHPMLQ